MLGKCTVTFLHLPGKSAPGNVKKLNLTYQKKWKVLMWNIENLTNFKYLFENKARPI